MTRKFDKEGNRLYYFHVTLNEGKTAHKKLIDALEDGLLKDQGYATTFRQLALAGVRAKKEQS